MIYWRHQYVKHREQRTKRREVNRKIDTGRMGGVGEGKKAKTELEKVGEKKAKDEERNVVQTKTDSTVTVTRA